MNALRPLNNAMTDGAIVAVERRSIATDTLCGVVLSVGPRLTLIRQLSDGFTWNGFILIRTRDVSKVRWDKKYSEFCQRVLARRTQSNQQPRQNFRSFHAVARTFLRTKEVIALYYEEIAADECKVGRITKVSRSTLRLMELNTDAQWSQMCLKLNFREISAISFREDYLEALGIAAPARLPRRVDLYTI